jgi:hypothetical protein
LDTELTTQNSKLQPQNFLSSLALPVCLSAMDACWLYTVGWLFTSTVLEKVMTLPLPSPVVLAGIALAAWGVAELLLNRTSLPTWLVQTVGMLAGIELAIVTMAVLTPPAGDRLPILWLADAAAGATLCFILWLRGLFRAAKRPAFNDVYIDFQIGLAIVGLGALIAPLFIGARFGTLWTQIATLPVWFFVFGLIALALGNREVVRQEIGRVAGGSWGLVLAASVGIIVLIGTLSAVFGGPDLLGLVQGAVGAVIVAISAAIYGIIYAILWLWYAIFHPTLGVIAAPPTATPNNSEEGDPLEFLRKAREQQQDRFDIPSELLQISLWVAAGLVCLAALWFISLGFRRYRKRVPPNTVEEREKLGSWDLFTRQLRGLLDRLLARFRRKGTADTEPREDDLAALAGRPEWSGTLSVRQIYARLLVVAGTVGYQRAPQDTPIEYLALLSSAMPNLHEDFRTITAAYLEARYGPLPAASPAVLAAANAWSRAEPELLRVKPDA